MNPITIFHSLVHYFIKLSQPDCNFGKFSTLFVEMWYILQCIAIHLSYRLSDICWLWLLLILFEKYIMILLQEITSSHLHPSFLGQLWKVFPKEIDLRLVKLKLTIIYVFSLINYFSRKFWTILSLKVCHYLFLLRHFIHHITFCFEKQLIGLI